MSVAGQTGLRKRQQIDGANKMMFIWVAGASVIVGAALVAAVFIGQKLIFTEKVLQEKQTTSSTLSDNLDNIGKLKDQVRVLNTNSALKSSMTKDETEPIQVVLDALPSDANSTALGASLQQKFLNKPDITVQSLSVIPIEGVESGDDSASTDEMVSTASNSISFNFTVSIKNADAVEQLLKDLERSIRTIDLTNVTINYQDDAFVVNADGVAYYEPAKTVKLQDKTIKP